MVIKSDIVEWPESNIPLFSVILGILYSLLGFDNETVLQVVVLAFKTVI